MRWSEEVLLLEEEMRRVQQFLAWQAKWWDDRQMLFEDLPAAEAEGMRGYALRQAALRRALQDSFSKQWADVPQLLKLWERHPEVAAAAGLSR
jgi:hypothetical protein